MRFLAIVAVVLAVVLAGCVGDDANTDDVGSDHGPVTAGTNETLQIAIQEETGSFLSGLGAGCSPFGGFFGAFDGVFDHFSFAPAPAVVGANFTATFNYVGEPLELAVQFWANSDTVVAAFTGSGSEVTGVVPEGADLVIVTACGPALDVSVDYVASFGEAGEDEHE